MEFRAVDISKIKMRLRNYCLMFLVCYFLAFDHSKLVSSNEITTELCDLATDELIRYHGYEAEVHYVTTEDGYILTVFRCYSKNPSSNSLKPVIMQHGLFDSSDNFCINPPNQALAYVFADNGYDVWLPNSRGNYYSRQHHWKNPDFPLTGFWNFSWYEIGIYDQPATIDYVLQQTSTTKLHYLGHSQGSTSIIVLLSEKPEYNEKIHAASLLAMGGYMRHDSAIYKILAAILPEFMPTEGFELLPRYGIFMDSKNKVCKSDPEFCNEFINFICGPSENQRNITMLPALMCHIPSGASTKQLLHYAQEVRLGYFGQYATGWERPRDFMFSNIMVPISFHYSTADSITTAADIELFIPKIKNVIFIQRIDKAFNHLDFLWSMHAADLVYSKILFIFQSLL